ncbi:MAG: hypothetical protein JSU63_04295, partial [Phycisphaerales bacterium]
VYVDLPYVYTGGNSIPDFGPSMVTFRVTQSGSDQVDGDMDLGDFAAFQSCFGGHPVDARCLTFDVDEDGDVDHADMAAWQEGMTGPM